MTNVFNSEVLIQISLLLSRMYFDAERRRDKKKIKALVRKNKKLLKQSLEFENQMWAWREQAIALEHMRDWSKKV